MGVTERISGTEALGGGSCLAGPTTVLSPRPFPLRFAVTEAASALRAAGFPRKLHGLGRGAGPRTAGGSPESHPPLPHTARGGCAVGPRPRGGTHAPRKREAAPGPPPRWEQCGASGCSAARDPGARSPERRWLREGTSGRAGERARADVSAAVPPREPWARRGARLQSGAAGRCGGRGRGPGDASRPLRGRGPRG